MKIEINTKEDSHDEIKKVIKMLQHIVGESQEVFTNEPSAAEASPMANIFGDTSQVSSSSETASETQEAAQEQAEAQETSQSTDDIFAELFSEEEINKMDAPKAKEEEEDEEEELPKPKSKKYDLEFY